MEYSGPEQKSADELVYSLQRSYPSSPIYRDPLSDETEGRVKELRNFVSTGPSQVTAIVADESFRPRVDDFNIVKDVENTLKSAGIQVEHYKDGEPFRWNNGRGRGLIVITAHSTDSLATFVRKLGESGAFEGNFVLFNSCGTDLTRSLISEINSRYKAVATFNHEGIIPANNMRSFLNSFSQILSNGNGKTFGELLMDSLHMNQLNGVWTVSQLDSEKRRISSAT